jgi:hypothetical protein
VEKICHRQGRVESIRAHSSTGEVLEFSANQFISSMPLRNLIKALEPAPPGEILRAADALRYRDFITVVLIVDRENVFPDNWIYIQAPEFKMGRIQNYKNWSPEMVPDASKTSLGLEYFVSEHDRMWSWSDKELIELGIKECTDLGFIKSNEVLDGTVVRMKKAYPVYDQARVGNVAILQSYLKSLENLQTIGRNGQHRYNNQDHSMLTGLYAARNVVGEKRDVWAVNVDDEYHEEMAAERKRAALVAAATEPGEEVLDFADVLRAAFARLDPVALGLSVGVVCGFGLFLATAALLIKGGDVIGPRLALLNHYLIGYQVTWAGALVGLVEAAVVGYVIGYICARLHNLLIDGYIYLVQRVAEIRARRDIL